MSEPRNHVHLTGDFAASPDEVFTFFTERFGEIEAGKMEHVSDGSDPSEPASSSGLMSFTSRALAAWATEAVSSRRAQAASRVRRTETGRLDNDRLQCREAPFQRPESSRRPTGKHP